MNSMTNEAVYRIAREFDGTAPRIKKRSNMVRVIVATALAAALSSCAATQTKVVTLDPRSTAFGYPNPAKPQIQTKKTASNSKVISKTVATATYLGRAPYICTPS